MEILGYALPTRIRGNRATGRCGRSVASPLLVRFASNAWMSVRPNTLARRWIVRGVLVTMEPCQPGGLRGLRESRGLTQQELAEAVGRLAWAQNERGVGVNADMISKWERGVKWPSRMYVRLLSDFFGLAVPEFCLVLGSLGSLKTPDPPTAVLSSLSDPASIFGFGIDAMLSEDSVRRRSMLRLMGVVPLSIVLTPTAGAASASPASSPELTSQP